VAAGCAPRTTGYETPEAMLDTPGSSITTRNGSPWVPGTSRSSWPCSEWRDSSVRSRSPRTMVSYGSATSGSSRYTTLALWLATTVSSTGSGTWPGAWTVYRCAPAGRVAVNVPPGPVSATAFPSSPTSDAPTSGLRVPFWRTSPFSVPVRGGGGGASNTYE